MASNCCCGDRCQLKDQPADKHWCPGCNLPIHAICGILDETQDSIAHMNWCYTCDSGRKMPAVQVTQPHPSLRKTGRQTSRKKPPPSLPTDKNTNRASKPFKIVVPAQQCDPLLGRKVAFPLGGPDQPQWLTNPVLQQYGEEIGGIRYLRGNVSRSKSSNSKTPYLIEWESTKCGTTPMDGGTVMNGVEYFTQLQDNNHHNHNKKRHPLSSRLQERLFEVDEDEIGRQLSSDDDSNKDSDDESIYQTNLPPKSSIRNHLLDLQDLLESGFNSVPATEDGRLVEEIDVVQDGLRWKLGGTLNQPLNVSKNEVSRLKTGTAQHFTTPLSSFLSFVPLEFWKLWVYESNRYANEKLLTENTSVSFKALSLQEFMTFFGILLAMTLQPMPGRRYTKAWEEPDIHPYTKHMKKSRFIQIRSILHMVNNQHPNSKNDSLYKVRPLLNVLKKTLGAFIEVGSECSLDESSVACRSAYGRGFIYYNPTKPTGKYHFRFYLLCETDFYNCVRFRMQTRDDCDVADGLNLSRPINIDGTLDVTKKKEQHVMQRLVLDMCSPLFFTGKVVNTDNYYTSPQVFVELWKKGVYARGTCRGNRVAFPKCIQFTPSEVNKGQRGDLHIATSHDPPLVAFSWLDGNPVNFLSSADGTEHSEVQRRIGRQKKRVPAPAAVAKYNKYMQAVDRFDQLNQLFSLATRHKFKKYYNKLTMALLDIALVNAEQHYFMVEGRTRRDEARYHFRKELSQLFIETNWDHFQPDGQVASLNNLFMSPQDVTIQVTEDSATAGRVLAARQRDQGFLMAPMAEDLKNQTGTGQQKSNTITCQPISVMAFMKQNHAKQSGGRSYRGSRCQVCAWEMRSNVTKHVAFCSEHGIRMCTVLRPLPQDSPFTLALQDRSKSRKLTEWYCPDQSVTCWQKGHEFYIPLGVWGTTPKIRYDTTGCPKTISAFISAEVYKKRSDWLVSEGLLQSVPKSRGRKRKQSLKSADALTEQMEVTAEPVNHDDGREDEELFYDSIVAPQHEEYENEN